MLVYPQLTSGALTQFPIQKSHGLRTVINGLADGSQIKLADPSGETTEWQLQYTDLSDEEASALEAFFESTEGSLNVFTFLDPTANLLAWSDHLNHAEWTKDPLLTVTSGVADPAGGANGWHMANSGEAAQNLSQVLEAPGGYLYCLSVYVKADAADAQVTLFRDSASANFAAGSEWRRLTFSGSGNASAEAIEFGIGIPAGDAVDIYGMQVEPQVAASTYKPSILGGIYPTAWFREDFLAMTATGVNRHSATVNILHAIRL